MAKHLEFEPSSEVGFEDEGEHDTNLDDPVYNKQWTLPIRTAAIYGAAVMRVQAGTNCPQGGSAKEGGRTIFRLDDLGSTGLAARVVLTDGKDLTHDLYDVSTVSIMVGGDAEAEMLVAALEFAAETLRQQLRRHYEERYNVADGFSRILRSFDVGGEGSDG